MILWHLENMLTLTVMCMQSQWHSVWAGLWNSENLSWKGALKVLKLVTHKRGGTLAIWIATIAMSKPSTKIVNASGLACFGHHVSTGIRPPPFPLLPEWLVNWEAGIRGALIWGASVWGQMSYLWTLYRESWLGRFKTHGTTLVLFGRRNFVMYSK